MSERLSLVLRGAVQGIGFRPFIYRLAVSLDVKGFVLNSPSGVFIEAEQTKPVLNDFLLRIEKEKPKHAIIQSMEFSFLDTIGYKKFEIRESKQNGVLSAFIMPDIALCDDCLKEMLDAKDRRYLYPFINCTNCGPRFSIIESLPYDRPNTSMKIFEMCDDCKGEYENPVDRRFHAQPIACPVCGPQLLLADGNGNSIAEKHNALLLAVEKINEGKIIALKGIGGYQLICRADDEKAISLLRKRKNRNAKPFAVMMRDLESVKKVCEVNAFEELLLSSPESPIVLLKKKNISGSGIIHESAAPGNPMLGVMLPYTPLHHLLMHELNIPVIATSGNLSEEPIAIADDEALLRLHGIADYFLMHNRNIVRHVDDSIVRVMLDREMVMRRARGYAPLPVQLSTSDDDTSFLAVGGHLKNTVALSSGKNIFLSQHIGDLSTQEAFNAFQQVVQDFSKLYEAKHITVTADLHPDYLSTKFSKEHFSDIAFVQHHQAHVASCYAENQIEGSVLGVAWDGTGFGTDGTIWGGEFFIFNGTEFTHAAQFKKFRLPGGDLAIKEPKRSAAGLHFEIFGEESFHKNDLLKLSDQEKKTFLLMLQKNINSPLTSSVGRIYDAVASLLDLQQVSSFEGEAAMKLEFAADATLSGSYPFKLNGSSPTVIDYHPMIKEMISDIQKNISVEVVSAKFHNTLAEIISAMAEKFCEEKVVLSGGVFQNAFLLQRTVERLRDKHFKPYWHQRIPTNDGGISLGQIAITMNRKKTVPETMRM